MRIMKRPLGKRHVGKPKRKLYDLVYYLRHKEQRNRSSREYIKNTPDYQIYAKLYSRWRIALANGRTTVPFNAPPKAVRIAILNAKESGCAMCKNKENLQLDHIDRNLNHNSLENLRWLCRKCHHEETNRGKLDDIYDTSAYKKVKELVRKKPFTSYEVGETTHN